MYNVVSKTIAKGTHTGVITWTSYKSKKDFDKQNNKKMKKWYQVITEGVSPEQAVEICSTPEANMAAFLAAVREANKMLRETLSQIYTPL